MGSKQSNPFTVMIELDQTSKSNANGPQICKFKGLTTPCLVFFLSIAYLAYPNIKISLILFSFLFVQLLIWEKKKTISKEQQQHFRRRQSVPSGLEMRRSLSSPSSVKSIHYFSQTSG